MIKKFYIFAFAIVLSGSFSTFGQVTGAAKVPEGSTPFTRSADDRYRIGYQDVLEIQVYKHPDLNRRVAVNTDGTILLHRLDKPMVALCKTERELAEEIGAAYGKDILVNPSVSVFVSEQKSQAVAVMGAVEKPGTYYVNRKVHLLEMLAMAGGPNKESGTRMIVARTGSSSNCRQEGEPDENSIAVMDYKLRDVQEGKQTLWMQPGDVVSVLDADVVYVYGEVNKQGSYRVREAITLTQAIVSAEGLAPSAKRGAVRILRQPASGGERVEFTFDLSQIDKGKVKDPFLEPNDIVAISRDTKKAILNGVASMLKSSVPNAIYRLP